MTPIYYTKISRRLQNKKLKIAFPVFLGIVVTFLSVFVSKEIDQVLPHKYVFLLGQVTVFAFWWLLMIAFWYGPNSKLCIDNVERESTEFVLGLQAWCGAIFLDIWFVAVVTFCFAKLWRHLIGF